jgi:hypothetical protein
VVYDAVYGSLNSNALVWKEDGNAIGTRPQIVHSETAAGQHVITLTATKGSRLNNWGLLPVWG